MMSDAPRIGRRRRTERPHVLIVVNSPTSGPGNLLEWFDAAGLEVSVVEGAAIPDSHNGYDGVVLLGGGLLPYDDDRAPWLGRERALAQRCIDDAVPLLGICLGAQLLAAVAGGVVEGNVGTPERGVVRVRRRSESSTDPLLAGVSSDFAALQNHRDQITALPSDASHLAENDDCRHQAFRVGTVAWGVQFHPEAPVSRLDNWDEAALHDEGVDLPALRRIAVDAEPQLLEASERVVANFAGVVSETSRSRELRVIDGHNDLLWEMRERSIEANRFLGGIDELQTDLPKLRAGNLAGQFWSVWVPDGTPQPLRTVLEQVRRLEDLVAEASDFLALTPTVEDVRRTMREERIACLIGAEGAHCLEGDLANVSVLARAGVRYMTVTHNATTMWADSATDEARHDGLSARGAHLIAALEGSGILVDLSHTSHRTMNDVLDIATAPVIFSHSSSYAVTPHPRNAPDAVLRRLADNGGVQMITFVPAFVAGGGASGADRSGHRARLTDVADHIEHACEVAGIAHVGIGGDFDGIAQPPDGLDDTSTYPALFAELRRRGWSGGELAALAAGNILRVLAATDAAFQRGRQISKE